MDDQTTHDRDRAADAGRLERLPDHEDDRDVARTSGGGILGEGGTAIDRGTGTLDGIAQGHGPRDDGDEGEFAEGPGDKLIDRMTPGTGQDKSVPSLVAAPVPQGGVAIPPVDVDLDPDDRDDRDRD